jgi:AraC-like DNA-binding protein
MESVKTLLVSSFLSVKEVMKEAGLAQADETSFIREFKRMVGLTPGQFRSRSWAAQRRRRSKEHLMRAA